MARAKEQTNSVSLEIRKAMELKKLQEKARRNPFPPGSRQHDMLELYHQLQDPEGWPILTKERKRVMLDLISAFESAFCSSLPIPNDMSDGEAKAYMDSLNNERVIEKIAACPWLPQT